VVVVVQFYRGDFLHVFFFYRDLIINIDMQTVRICVKFLDLNCIFLQDNVQSYWDLEICSK